VQGDISGCCDGRGDGDGGVVCASFYCDSSCCYVGDGDSSGDNIICSGAGGGIPGVSSSGGSDGSSYGNSNSVSDASGGVGSCCSVNVSNYDVSSGGVGGGA